MALPAAVAIVEMPMSMKIIMSAIAVALVLALPSVGETAQKKKKNTKVRPAPTAQQYSGPYQVRGSRTRAGTPCVAYTWEGCLGWDPDPFIRSMIDRDRGQDDR
jgi:uncharacterized protein YraI